MIAALLTVGALLAALAGAALAAWVGYQRGRRANWQAGERIIARLLDELELMEAAEREWLAEHQLTEDERATLARMH